MLTKLTAAASRAREAAITSTSILLLKTVEDSNRTRLVASVGNRSRVCLSRARLVASVGYQRKCQREISGHEPQMGLDTKTY
jgi:hypothetical protein